MKKEIRLEIDIRPPSQEPAWAGQVERWYQLDEVSYAFCEALHQWQGLADFEKPETIFLALPGASNLADRDFVESGAVSPAKFVYTLPNICISVIFQLLGFHGRVVCFNQGETTLAFVQNEARRRAERGRKTWVLASAPALNDFKRAVSVQIY